MGTAATEYMSMGTMNTMGAMNTMRSTSAADFAFGNASTMSSGDLLSPPSTANLDAFLTFPSIRGKELPAAEACEGLQDSHKTDLGF